MPRLPWVPLIVLATSGCAPVLGVEETRYENPDACVLMPTRLYFAEPLDHDAAVSVAAITKLELAELAMDVGSELDPGLGHAIASIFDCDEEPLADASLGLDPLPGAATKFVIDEAGAQGATETSELGLIGAFNLPTGVPIELQALPQAISPFASSKAEIVPMPGELGAIALRPTSGLTVPTTPDPGSLSCVGTTSPPMTNANSVTLTVTVIEAQELKLDGEMLANIEVRACVSGDDACSIVATTNDDGVAILTLPVTSGLGFEGQITIEGSHSDCP